MLKINVSKLFIDTMKQEAEVLFKEKNVQKQIITKTNFINDFILRNHLCSSDIRIMLENIYDAYEKAPAAWEVNIDVH